MVDLKRNMLTISGPASFAVPELWCLVNTASDGLDVTESLHDIIEVGLGGIVESLSLPESESIDHSNTVS